ncbi:acyltransferase family protein [Brevibacillus sp. Leaf182]|uniref:acyltransferase family protein n=1 Tax=Brevibacillus sp. Leaf182 TaxID=1736290 RepID=UPI0006FA343D|nr:acyltransferase family protein [Brevibacillus sp. Leaf182]RAT94139.1 acetyltransferase [Brevibacillus sp. Leaf182]
MPKPLNGNGRYMAGLDGLRALAVFAVIVYHLNVGWAPGGLLGVGVFFVLSGYLITDILLAQWKRDGKIDWKDFWLRRGRRLMPALLVTITVVMVWITLLDRSQLTQLRGEVLSTLLYVNNWWRIFQEVSYFSSFGPSSPFGHFWSLAVEEQFYLLWPLLLVISLHFSPRRWRLLALTLALTLVSALAMALLYEPGIDPSRVYYGTDTRAFALLIGAALAMIWPSRSLSVKAAPRARLLLDCIGAAGLVTIVVMIWLTDPYDSFLYRGGFVLLSVATAAVVAVLAHPVSRLGKVLGWKPLRWLGVRSYGIYLWHYPVIVLTSPVVNTGETSIVRSILQVIASVVLAALSWRFIEEPIRNGGLVKRKMRKNRVSIGRNMASVYKLLVFMLFLVSITSCASNMATSTVSQGDGNLQTDGTASPNSQQEFAAALDSKEHSGHDGSLPPDHPVCPDDYRRPDLKLISEPNDSKQPVETLEPDSGQRVTAIGDSVMLDVAPYLKNLLPGITINGKVGRQLSEAQDVVDQLKTNGMLGDVVIIELGTNGPFSEETLVNLLNSLKDVRQIVLVNTRVPRPWEQVVNSALEEAANQFSNVTLVDWYAASANKDSYFAWDGVHLVEEGTKVYASLIEEAIKPQQNGDTQSGTTVTVR